MQQRGNETYDLISVFFIALSFFVCIFSLLIMGDVISAGPFEPEEKLPTPTLAVQGDILPSSTPSPITPSTTPAPATATSTGTSTWTPFPSNTPSHTPTASRTGTSTVTRTLTPSSTATETSIPPTTSDTPTATIPTATPTETVVPTTPGPSPTLTATVSAFPLTVQQGTPLYRDAYLHPGCAWQGIAGQITLLGGAPGTNFTIRVTGTTVSGEATTISGTNTNYGSSGWEIQVATAAAVGTYTIQVLDANGIALSPEVNLSFQGACDQNLVLINFVQVRPF